MTKFAIFFLYWLTNYAIFSWPIGEFRLFILRQIDQIDIFFYCLIEKNCDFWLAIFEISNRLSNFKIFFSSKRLTSFGIFFPVTNWRVSQFFSVTKWRNLRFFFPRPKEKFCRFFFHDSLLNFEIVYAANWRISKLHLVTDWRNSQIYRLFLNETFYNFHPRPTDEFWDFFIRSIVKICNFSLRPIDEFDDNCFAI